jgi:hypothetical protein
MPKLSYAQEVAALEETLAAVRASADVLPPLALTVADELAEQIAEIKALKGRQRFYAAEGKVVTQALNAEIAGGMVQARYIRACAVLLYGPKNARLTQFGIRLRRRPRRKAGIPPEVAANPLGRGEEVAAAALDAAWTAHAGRAGDAENRAELLAVGGDAGRIGGKAAGVGENAAGDRARVQPVGGFPAGVGGPTSGDGENALATRGKAQGVGATLQTNRGAAIRAA